MFSLWTTGMCGVLTICSEFACRYGRLHISFVVFIAGWLKPLGIRFAIFNVSLGLPSPSLNIPVENLSGWFQVPGFAA